jgi:hypothetical protein
MHQYILVNIKYYENSSAVSEFILADSGTGEETNIGQPKKCK